MGPPQVSTVTAKGFWGCCSVKGRKQLGSIDARGQGGAAVAGGGPALSGQVAPFSEPRTAGGRGWCGLYLTGGPQGP